MHVEHKKGRGKGTETADKQLIVKKQQQEHNDKYKYAVSLLFLGLDPQLFLRTVEASCWEQAKSSQRPFLCSHCYLPSAQLLYKLNKNGCADGTITNHQPLCFCYKDTGRGCLLLGTAACLFPPSERCQVTSLPPVPPPWYWGTHLCSASLFGPV